MSKLYSFAFYCLLACAWAATPAAGQAPAPGPRVCATPQADAWQQAALKRQLPGYSAAKRASTVAPGALRAAAATYTLPVVVHVIHNGEAVGTGTNISQAQVQSQLDVLNEDYRNLNADGALVPGVFQPLRADAQFQFVLAARDPSGAPMAEPGIDRVDRTAKGFSAPPYSLSYAETTIKPGTDWNPDQYLNIWVMNLGGGVLGYAQFPDNTAGLGGLSPLGGMAATDGVVILYSAFGRVGTLSSTYNKGRTLTHELGHWLGLLHVWGDADCGNDYCADTPTQQTGNYGCPTFPHITCSNGPSGDMFMNYLDYVDDACMAMFSGNQKDRMQAVFAANTPRRGVLLTSPALCTTTLVATATNSGATCAGNPVRLTATGPAGVSYAWHGPNGYVSTEQNPTLPSVSLMTAGVYTVTVSNSSGACPGTASTTVVVSPAPPRPTLARSATAVCPGTAVTLSATIPAAGSLPSEDFNGTAPGWTIGNAGLASTAWQYRPAPFSYSSAYVELSSYSLNGSRFALANSDIGGANSTTNTTLVSPVFSTVGYSTLQVAFQQYYRNDPGDLATVEISTDGGTTWAPVATYIDGQGTSSRPASSLINLNAYVSQPSVQLRWHYMATWAYFWAIDNVAVTGTPAPFTYAWSLVSGNGLPATAAGPTLTVSPTQSSVYRVTVSSPSFVCTTSDTIGVRLAAPVWSGAAGNGNWFDAANWLSGCVPTRATDAVIPAGLSTPYPTLAGGTAEVRTLTQQGSLTLAAGELALYGDYAGTGALTQTGGAVATRGAAAQTLRPSSYQTLLIAGTGPKTIGAATIGSSLTLAGPVLSTGPATLTLAPTATLTETDASYVLGKVQTARTLGTTPDSFGGLGLLIAAASPPGPTTVVRTTGQPQGVGPASSISRYFDITAATGRSLPGATLSQQYAVHELNSLPESQLTMFRSADAGATWTNEGATQRDAAAHLVRRAYVTDLNGRWTLASAASPPTPAASAYAINAFPVPFGADGLSIQVTTATAGPLSAKLYDVLGRLLYDQALASVEVGTSTLTLPGSGQLAPAKYILVVQQGGQTARLTVVRQ
ncbi:M43 family zinc metalloprotease [Hymenobacter cheonanensis]|uniref:M43 family zinc metalloprotease n=1 Tax=Hymenobacter sp. CA2-7 TaxID=3063993 RepID=UPI002713A689|nr:M43 family zinc metalloprotease [Hymenobacter sp. CA2-7]MDO7886512.1 M43 family zinc metalloprotease [Hymenobacter sp. CA2-7]